MHREALWSSSQDTIDLLEAQPEDTRWRSKMSDVTPDDNMCEFYDKMDNLDAFIMINYHEMG